MLEFLEKRRYIPIILVVLFALGIFISSSVSTKGGAGSNFFSIFYHFSSFFLLSFFLLIAISGNSKKFIFISIIISVFYALSDEIHQFFVPFRSCSFADFLIDMTGIMLAALSYSCILLVEKSLKFKQFS